MDKLDFKWKKDLGNKAQKYQNQGANSAGKHENKVLVGYATIIDSLEMTVKELKKYNEKHQANDFLVKYAREEKTLFAWVLDDINSETKPKSYSYSTGSWCKA